MIDVVAPVSAPGRLTIDLGALADNWRDLARRAAPGRCAAVIKANAYGTGVSEAAPALWAAGARVFFVAHFSEGIAARRVLPAEAAIYVLNGLESGADPADYVEHRLAPAIGGEEELKRWSAFAARRGETSPSALHLDTGMNRLGFESLARLQSAMETHGRDKRGRLADEPFRFVRDPRRPHQPGADRAFRGGPRGIREPPRVARQLVWHVPRSVPDLRSGASGLRALRRQSDAGPPKPDAPRRDADCGDPADTLNRNGHELRLQRAMDRQAPDPARDRAHRLCRRPAARRRRDRCEAGGRSRGRWASLRRSSDACRWTSPSSTSPTCPRTPFDRATRSSSSARAIDLDDFATRSGTIGYALLTSLGPRHQRDYVR